MTEHKESSVLARFASPLLILATIIWGSSFVVMKSSVDVLPTFWLLAIRFSFAALVLAVVFIRRWKVLDKQYLIGGTVMGFCLFLAYTFQTFGLEQTTSGKNAFFTAVYCVIVPFLYWFIAKRRPDRFNLIAAFLCIGGIALVSITGDNASAFNMGDVLTLIGGFFFAAHIVAVSRYSEGRDIFILTTLQFASFALFSWLGVLITRPALTPGVFDSSLIMGWRTWSSAPPAAPSCSRTSVRSTPPPPPPPCSSPWRPPSACSSPSSSPMSGPPPSCSWALR